MKINPVKSVRKGVKKLGEKEREMKSIILSNIPNFLTMSRIALTFVIGYMVFAGVDLRITITVFAAAALTDFLDGQLARRCGWTSEFGRKADMIADRFLWIGTTLAFVAYFGMNGELKWFHGLQMLIIMSREIISAPFAVIAFLAGNLTPQARYVAKVTTFIQGFALPLIILSIFYPFLIFLSLPISIAACITGFISAMYYLKDIQTGEKKK